MKIEGDGDQPLKPRENKPVSRPINRPKIISSDSPSSQIKAINATLIRAARNILRAMKIESWQEFEQLTSLPVVPPFSGAPYSTEYGYGLLTFLEKNGAAILQAMDKAQVESRPEIVAPTYHKIVSDDLMVLADGSKLKPQQQKAHDVIVETFDEWHRDPINAKYSGVIIPLDPGLGKSFITAACFITIQGRELLNRLYSGFVLTPASVVMKTEAKFAELGVKELNRNIIIGSHQLLSTNKFAGLYTQEVVRLFDNDVKEWRWMYDAPLLCNVDEFHWMKKMHSQRTQRCFAWVHEGKTFWIFTSATPGVTLKDMEFVSLAIRPRYLTGYLSRKTFPAWINRINDGSRIPINRPNEAAMARYRAELAPIFVSPPKDPQKTKATNRVMLIDFANEEHRRMYMEAEDKWLEAKRRAGENPSERGIVMSQFTILRQAGEICSVPTICSLAEATYNKGLAPVIGVGYQEVLRDIVKDLVQKHHIPREQIAVIWGGSEITKQEDLLSDDECAELLMMKLEGYELPKDKASRLKKTMRYMKDRLRRSLSPEEKIERDRFMKELGLDRQNPRERFIENQMFLDGRKNVCVFTLSAGGTGIDLDHQKVTARQREGFFTICYYGEEFLQALGRTKRIASLTNTNQWMLFLKGTLAHQHIAPRLDRKLASIHRLATGGEDYMAELMKPHISRKPEELIYTFRTDAEILMEEPEVFGDEDGLIDDDDNGED